MLDKLSDMTIPFDRILLLMLRVQDLDITVWRRLEVPSTYTFWDLHCGIQNVFGWDYSYTFVFHARDANGNLKTFSMNNVRNHYATEFNPSWQFRIEDYLPRKGSQLQYFYDLGSPWVFSIELEDVTKPLAGAAYPRCLEGARAILEDCAGSVGFNEVIEILEDPSHPAYESTCNDLGEGFDPEFFNAESVRFDDPEDIRLWIFLESRLIGDLIDELPTLKGKCRPDGRYPIRMPIRLLYILMREGLSKNIESNEPAGVEPANLATVFLSKADVDNLADKIAERMFEKQDSVAVRQLDRVRWYLENVKSELFDPNDAPKNDPSDLNDIESFVRVNTAPLRHSYEVDPDPNREVKLAAAAWEIDEGSFVSVIVCLNSDDGRCRFVAMKTPVKPTRASEAVQAAQVDLTSVSSEADRPYTDFAARSLMQRIGYGTLPGLDLERVQFADDTL